MSDEDVPRREQVEFEIRGKCYPAPAGFRLVDPVLVESLTGLDWLEWTERLPDEDGNDPRSGKSSQEPLVMLGMIAVAVWQANPTWRRDRVERFMRDILITEVTVHGADAEDDALPPAEAATPAALSSTSAETSRAEPESDSAPTPLSSGLPG